MNSGGCAKTPPDHDAGDRGQYLDEADERADRHGGQRPENIPDTRTARSADHQPVEGLDDGGVMKRSTEQILNRNIGGSPGKSTYDSRQTCPLSAKG